MLVTASRSDTLATAIETVAGVAGFSLLENEWNTLLQSSDSDCLFLTWDWLFTWWKHLADGKRLSILALRSGADLVALAPLCASAPVLSRGQILPALQFVGAGSVGSDYLDIIAQPGYESTAAHAFANKMDEHRLPLQLTQLRRGEAASYRAARALDRKGWSRVESAINVCPYIPLDGCSWNSLLASLGAEFRYGINRKWKRLHRDFTVLVEEVHPNRSARPQSNQPSGSTTCAGGRAAARTHSTRLR